MSMCHIPKTGLGMEVREKGMQPQYPASQPTFPANLQHVIQVVYTFQTKENSFPDNLLQKVQNSLNKGSEFKPLRSNVFILIPDGYGYYNKTFIAYWDHQDKYKGWTEETENSWSSGDEFMNGDIGFIREEMLLPLDTFEYLLSGPPGFQGNAPMLAGEYPHESEERYNYLGSMRDRLKMSNYNTLDTDITILHLRATTVTLGKKIQVFPTDNICLINSGQNLINCDDEEKDIYYGKVEPVLKKGVAFLHEHSMDTHCISSYLLHYASDKDEPIPMFVSHIYFTSIVHLENWAWNHSTHGAIYYMFLNQMAPRGEKNQIKLWHQVNVLPKGNLKLLYVNVHNQTGFLRYSNFEQKVL